MARYSVALTGGIASGKSEVERRFRALGVAVADADQAAREAVAPGTPGLAAVVAAFGPGVLAADGSLDRPAMRRRVFADDGARRRLEAIVHPLVRSALRAACEAAPGPYAIAAIPLFAEAGRPAYAGWIQRVLVVDVPVEVQLERLLRRDGIDEVPTDGYTVWDASASATFALGGVTLRPVLAVDNLLDARYVDPLSRYRPYGVPAPGRSVRLRLIATF